MLVGDYEFGRHPQDISLLKMISNVAAAAHAPVHRGGRARSCSTWTSFTELGAPRDLAKIFESVEYAPWKSFREIGGLALRRPRACRAC